MPTFQADLCNECVCHVAITARVTKPRHRWTERHSVPSFCFRSPISRAEIDQPRIRASEAAGVEVEGRQVWLEVDVEPLASGRVCMMRGPPHDLGADATALPAATRLRIEQERVISTVPSNVDEPDQDAVVVARRDPAEAVRADAVPPSGCRSAPVRFDELDHLVIGHRGSPEVLDLVAHDRSLALARSIRCGRTLAWATSHRERHAVPHAMKLITVSA